MKRRAFIPSPPAPLEDRIALSEAASAGAPATAAALTQSLVVNLYGLALGQDKTVGTVRWLRAADETISPLGTVSLRKGVGSRSRSRSIPDKTISPAGGVSGCRDPLFVGSLWPT
jgi:hypothetical protein